MKVAFTGQRFSFPPPEPSCKVAHCEKLKINNRSFSVPCTVNGTQLWLPASTMYYGCADGCLISASDRLRLRRAKEGCGCHNICVNASHVLISATHGLAPFSSPPPKKKQDVQSTVLNWPNLVVCHGFWMRVCALMQEPLCDFNPRLTRWIVMGGSGTCTPGRLGHARIVMRPLVQRRDALLLYSFDLDSTSRVEMTQKKKKKRKSSLAAVGCSVWACNTAFVSAAEYFSSQTGRLLCSTAGHRCGGAALSSVCTAAAPYMLLFHPALPNHREPAAASHINKWPHSGICCCCCCFCILHFALELENQPPPLTLQH